MLQDAGHELHLAHPMRTKAIASARVKTDAVDARTLAHLLRADLLPEAYIAPRELRDLRDLLRHRVALTRMRSALKNRNNPRALAPLDTARSFMDDNPPTFIETTSRSGRRPVRYGPPACSRPVPKAPRDAAGLAARVPAHPRAREW